MVQFITRSNAGALQYGDTSNTVVTLQPGADVSLNLNQDMILSMSRRGGTLELYLVNGQTVVIENFFVEEGAWGQSRLFLSSGGEISELSFAEGWGRVNTASYNAAGDGAVNGDMVFGNGLELRASSAARLETTTTTTTTYGLAGGINGGLLAGLAAVPLVGGALAGGGGGSSAAAAPVIPTATNNVNGSGASGTAPPGTVIDIDVDGDGVADYTTTADANGDWSVDFVPALPDGTNIDVTTTDSAGNSTTTSPPPVDATPPAAPTPGVVNADGASGVTDPGATIEIDIDGDGIPDYTTVADANGNWDIDFVPPLPDGAAVVIVATDVNGNTSASAPTTVDATPPAAPVLGAANANGASGTAEPGATVEIDIDGDGVPDYTVVADANGDWNVNFSPALPDGAVISLGATDTNNNAGGTATGTIDAVAPTVPMTGQINGDGAFGTAEPGSTVDIDINGDGVADYSVVVDANGDWNIDFVPALADGVVVAITATDINGNVSVSGGATIDATAPNAPGVIVVNASQVSGTGVAGDTINVDVTGNGVADYTTTVTASGTWSVTFTSALVNGAGVTVTAVDPNGNASVATSGTVDAVAPNNPQISMLNATTATGTAEANSTVSIDVDGDGAADYTVTADGNGVWSVNFSPALSHGASVAVSAMDGNLNMSAASSFVVDAQAPNAPSIATLNANSASGTTEAGATVAIDVTGNGVADYTTTADGSGNWTFSFTSSLANATAVSVTATDGNGNTSAAASGNVDATAPNAPMLDVSSTETTIFGAAEPGSTVSVSYVDSDLDVVTLNSVQVSGTGSWSSTPNPSLAVGTELFIAATDANGNDSGSALVMMGPAQTLDLSAPPTDIGTGIAAFEIEAINLADDTGNALTISESALLALSNDSDTLRIDGQAGNSVTAIGATDTGVSVLVDGQGYDVYSLGAGTLLVDQDITSIMT